MFYIYRFLLNENFMKNYLISTFIVLLLINYSCNYKEEQFSSEFIENLNFTSVYYKDFNNFHSHDLNSDSLVQFAEIDREERIIKDIDVKTPGLYVFCTIEKEFLFAYFDKPIKQKYFRIPEQDENIQWLEKYSNVYSNIIATNDHPALEELDDFDIPEDYKKRVGNLVSLTKVDKNVLLSFLQDYSLTKYYFMYFMGLKKPENIEIKEIVTADEYQYNMMSSSCIHIFSYLEFVPNYFNKDIYEFMIVKNRINDIKDTNQERIKKIQEDLDSMSNKLPALYEKYPQLFHFSINVMDALKKYPVVSEEGDTAYLIDYIDSEYTILYSWGTWCGPCLRFDKERLPALSALAESKGVPIITLAAEVRNEFDLWKEHLHGAKEGLINFFGYSKSDDGNVGPTINSLFQALNTNTFPNLMIIDKKGNVLTHKDARGDITTEFLEEL